ncbi:hypothetical protein Tco_1411869, partial [Tanacetum coccineum]
EERQRVDGETSLPRLSLKVRFRQQPPSIPLPSYDRERDKIHEATLLSLTMHKTAKAAEEQKNVAIVQEKILEEDIEKMVDGDDDYEATEFDGSKYLNDEEDFGTRLEPERHKKNSEEVYDDDDDMEEKKDDKKDDDDVNDDDDHTDHASIKDQVSGCQQLRIEKMQTPFLSPPRSLKIDLSSDKDITQELTGVVQRICRHQVLERILEQDIEKMVDDDDDSEATEFDGSEMLDDDDDSEVTEFDGSEYFNDGEDFGTRLEPGRHKKNSEEVDDDDDDMEEKKDDKKHVDDDDDDDGNDDDYHTDHASIRDQVSGSQQLRIEKMQTPIPLPPRSLRIDLSSDKDITQELTGVVQRMCRHQGIMMQQMEKKYVTNHEFHDFKERVDKVLNDVA